MRILYIPNDCSANGDLPFLVWGGVQATTGKLRQQNGNPVCKMLSFQHFFGFRVCVLAMAQIVRPHPD